VTPIFKILYLIYRGISGVRYRAVRRFTPAGLAVLIGAALSSMMAIDTDNNVDYQAFMLLLLILVLAWPFVFVFRARFTAERLLPRFGTVGVPLIYTVVVRNLLPKPQQGLTLLEEVHDPRPSFQDWADAQRAEQKLSRSFRMSQPRRTRPFRTVDLKGAVVPVLAGKGTAEVKAEVTPLRRGLLRFTGVTLARPDPLGLIRSFSRMSLPQSVLVLPKRYPVPPIALPGTIKYQQGGVAQASNVGQSEEFVALRDYRSGDPLRHIHWRSWARVGKPVVKEFEDEFFVRHALILDTFLDRERSELFEEAVSVAASFACTVQTQESLLDLLFVGPEEYCFTAGRGLAHVDQLLEVLASVRPCAHQSFSTLEALVLSHVTLVSGCICVLVAWDKARQDLVRKLVALNVPTLVLVLVTTEDEKLDPGPLKHDPACLHTLPVGDIERSLANLR
jgi:uncharacterized protein (DUF58 family)